MSKPGEYLMAVEIDYTNWKGERGIRQIVPGLMYFGSTQFHPESQWLLDAVDTARGLERTFAMKDIHSWKPVKGVN